MRGNQPLAVGVETEPLRLADDEPKPAVSPGRERGSQSRPPSIRTSGFRMEGAAAAETRTVSVADASSASAPAISFATGLRLAEAREAPPIDPTPRPDPTRPAAPPRPGTPDPAVKWAEPRLHDGSSPPLSAEPLLTIDGLEIGLILEPPHTRELFLELVDLSVVSDHVGFTAFSKLVDPSNDHTAGFLPRALLGELVARFGDQAKDPTDLLRLPPDQRRRGRNVDRYCSMLYLGTFDRQYARKFILFVPSLLRTNPPPSVSYASDYVAATIWIAAAARVGSIYFAGFGGVDGSFSNDRIAKLVPEILETMRSTRHERLRVYFKYWPATHRRDIPQLIERLREGVRIED